MTREQLRSALSLILRETTELDDRFERMFLKLPPGAPDPHVSEKEMKQLVQRRADVQRMLDHLINEIDREGTV